MDQEILFSLKTMMNHTPWLTYIYLYDRFFGYKDSYYHYYIYADKILFKKSDYKYFIRYNDVYD